MKVKRFSPVYFCLCFGTICCVLVPIGIAEQPVGQTQSTPVGEKQVDVITHYPSPGEIGREKKTVDVREVARNLRNEQMYKEARDILGEVHNAYLSSGTVNLLKTALNDNSVDENSVKVRQRSIILLGLSRNPEAITVISNRLKHDPSRRVRFNAAKSLGRLAGEASIPALKVALVEDRISGAVIQGLGGAGGRAVPLLIQMLKDDLKKGGNGANWFIQSLRRTGDRRAIKPLLDIISRPTSPSDRHMSRVQLEAARVLAHFATEWYVDILESRAKFSAVHPVTPTENRKVKAADQIRIVEALQNAGYDLNSLIWPLTFDKEE
jgi:hypothetical protein